MKKVLLIVPLSTTEWGKENRGGVDSVCQSIVKNLAERGSSRFLYRVLAFDPHNKISFTGRVQKLSSFVELVRAPSKERRFGLPYPGFLSCLHRVREQVKDFDPDVVHSHQASWVTGLNETRNVVTLHSYKKIGRKPVSFLNDLFYEKIMTRLSSFFIDEYTCVSEWFANQISEDVKNPRVIYNPIDEEYFGVGRTINTKRSNYKFVTCSLISRRKNIGQAIRLLFDLNERGSDSTLSVIGPNVDDVYFGELHKLVKDCGLERNVNFLGGLNRDEIKREFESSDVGVFSSAQETFGLAPLEMLASGLPLLSAKVGILSERYEEFNAVGVGFYQEMNLTETESWLTGLNDYVPGSAIEYIRKNFSVHAVLGEYERCYESLLNEY